MVLTPVEGVGYSYIVPVATEYRVDSRYVEVAPFQRQHKNSLV
jgi:hypothetical protein